MRILLLNQTFYPDVASTAQHLKDLALGLVERGNAVTDIASQRAYDDPATRFPKRERWRGIEIHRIAVTGFGKHAKWKRAADFGSFLAACALKLLSLPRHDVVVALTSPPLISFLGATLARVRGSRFVYWVMDLNPDEAIEAGWLEENSISARALDALSRFSFRQAHKIVALDRFMAERIAAKGIERGKIEVIPPWAHDDCVRFDAGGRKQFRARHGLSDKFVVMYSGNHSPCHPLDTVLGAALRLANDARFVFCFVGGGSEFVKVKEFAARESLKNILCLPYQPLDQLRASLSAGDLHLVVMGGPFVGTIHPCKIYNILSVGAPMLYIGPEPSHVTDIFSKLPNDGLWAAAEHGTAKKVAGHAQRICSLGRRGDSEAYARVAAEYSKAHWLPRFVDLVENGR